LRAGEPDAAQGAPSTVTTPDSDVLLVAWSAFNEMSAPTAPYVMIEMETTRDTQAVSLSRSRPDSAAPVEDDERGARGIRRWLAQMPVHATLCLDPGRWTELPPRGRVHDIHMPIQPGRFRQVARSALERPTVEADHLAAWDLLRAVELGVGPPGEEWPHRKVRRPFLVGPYPISLQEVSAGSASCPDLATVEYGVRVGSLSRSEVHNVLNNLSHARNWLALRVRINAQPGRGTAASGEEGGRLYLLFAEFAWVPRPEA
jgi:hypothetical protein